MHAAGCSASPIPANSLTKSRRPRASASRRRSADGAGTPHGICPYGVEAMGVMRIEKGHVTHNEINGTVTAADLGMGRMVSTTKSDFIGRAMLDREGLTDARRPRLVGLLPLDPSKLLRAGSHVLRKGDAATLENDQGYVTSGCFSPTVGSFIALGANQRGRRASR